MYAEYLAGDCLKDNFAFIYSSVGCGSGGADTRMAHGEAGAGDGGSSTGTNEARTLSEAREREQILKSFSEE